VTLGVSHRKASSRRSSSIDDTGDDDDDDGGCDYACVERRCVGDCGCRAKKTNKRLDGGCRRSVEVCVKPRHDKGRAENTIGTGRH
jgi:hypothetical protein